jgi:hypothetical protein
MKHKQSELLPVSWDRIEPLFVLGVRSIRSIGKQFGCSHVAILKHAKLAGWTRTLKPNLLKRAEKLQAHVLVTTKVTKG